jgi:hypothetical protein
MEKWKSFNENLSKIIEKIIIVIMKPEEEATTLVPAGKKEINFKINSFFFIFFIFLFFTANQTI